MPKPEMRNDYSAAGVLCNWFEIDLHRVEALRLPPEAYPPGESDLLVLTDFKKALATTSTGHPVSASRVKLPSQASRAMNAAGQPRWR